MRGWVSKIKMTAFSIPWAFSTVVKISNQSLKIVALLHPFGAPVTRAPSFESPASSVLNSRTTGRMMRGEAKPDALTAATTDMWKLVLISCVHTFVESLMAMTVLVVDFAVSKVSSMLKSPDESIFFSMSSLAIVLISTSTDEFPTEFRTLPMLCLVLDSSTAWRPRKYEYQPDVSCVNWQALVGLCNAS